MVAATKPAEETRSRVIDVYLGFEIRQHATDSFVAIPAGWSHPDIVLLEASDLPALRKRIWGWWHRLLD
jgi:hypothetical protein